MTEVFRTTRTITIHSGGKGGQRRECLLTLTDDDRQLQVVPLHDRDRAHVNSSAPMYIAPTVRDLNDQIERDGHWWQDYAEADDPQRLDIRA